MAIVGEAPGRGRLIVNRGGVFGQDDGDANCQRAAGGAEKGKAVHRGLHGQLG